MSNGRHPVSTDRVDTVIQEFIKFMDASGICLAEGQLAMTRLLGSFEDNELSKLRAFKTYVHQRLDDAGIPANPEPESNLKHGCRIEGRLNCVLKKPGVRGPQANEA